MSNSHEALMFANAGIHHRHHESRLHGEILPSRRSAGTNFQANSHPRADAIGANGIHAAHFASLSDVRATITSPSDKPPGRIWPWTGGAALIIAAGTYYFTKSVLLTAVVLGGVTVGGAVLILAGAAIALVAERLTWSHKGPGQRRNWFERLSGS